MNPIHIASPSAGTQSRHDEEQVRAMWQAGQFDQETLYWKKGMPEWRPVAELFAAPPPLPSDEPRPSPKITNRPRYLYTRLPYRLTSFLVVMLWICLATNAASLLSDVGQLSMLSRSYTQEEADLNDARQGLVALLALGAFVVTGVAFLKWIYRANQNCRGFGATDMKFSPRGSIGYYFVPFLNLVRPYQAMKEIWQVSRQPATWQTEKVGSLVGNWWTLWILSGVSGQMVFRMSDKAKTVEGLTHATYVSIASSGIDILLCIVAILLVKEIAARQELLVCGER